MENIAIAAVQPLVAFVSAIEQLSSGLQNVKTNFVSRFWAYEETNHRRRCRGDTTTDATTTDTLVVSPDFHQRLTAEELALTRQLYLDYEAGNFSSTPTLFPPLFLWDFKRSICVDTMTRNYIKQFKVYLTRDWIESTPLWDELPHLERPSGNQFTALLHKSITIFLGGNENEDVNDVLRHPMIGIEAARNIHEFFFLLADHQYKIDSNTEFSATNDYYDARLSFKNALEMTMEDFKGKQMKKLKVAKDSLTTYQWRHQMALTDPDIEPSRVEFMGKCVDNAQKVVDRELKSLENTYVFQALYRTEKELSVANASRWVTTTQGRLCEKRKIRAISAKVRARHQAFLTALQNATVPQLLYIFKRHSLSYTQYALSCIKIRAQRVVATGSASASASAPDSQTASYALLKAIDDGNHQIAKLIAIFL